MVRELSGMAIPALRSNFFVNKKDFHCDRGYLVNHLNFCNRENKT